MSLSSQYQAPCTKVFQRVLTVSFILILLFSALNAVAQQAYRFSSPLAAGSETSSQAVTVPITGNGTIGRVLVVTGGISGLDFVASSLDNCAPGNTASGSCSITVTFQPKAPGERRGAVVLLDTNGAVMGGLPLYGIGTGPVGVLIPGTINTVAGNGQWLYKNEADGGAATASPLYLPGGVAVDPAGNIYIADSSNNRIRFVNAQTGTISTVAGDGNPGFANDGTAGTTAEVNNPAGIVLDGAGNLYIADSGNHAVRKLTLATGTLTTVAGQLGLEGSSGDGGLATAARLDAPEGVALDAAGNLYISDTGNQIIRKVDAVTGIITTYAGKLGNAGYAGDGAQAINALLNTPWGLTTDANGDLFIADLSNSVIREISPSGIIKTIAGTGSSGSLTPGLPATSTNLKTPAAMLLDAAGNLYVADSGHNQVLKISAATQRVSIAAGNGNESFSGDQGAAPQAGLYGPYALALDSQGNLYVADMFHNRIRELFNSQATLTYPAVRVGRTSSAQSQTVENDGNANLEWTALTPDRNSAIDATASTCVVGTPVASGSTCTVAAQFSPQVTGSPVTGTIQLASNATNSPGTLTLSGESDALEPTKTTIVSSQNPSALSSVVTFTATVSGASPSGTIKFYDGSTLLGSSSTDSTGTATFNISSLTLGSHNITAAFTGDVSNSPSTSDVLVQVVKQTPTITLASNPNPAEVGQSTTFTATVVGASAQATGNVVFTDGETTVGTAALNPSGVATLAVSTLAAGTHSVVASYQGDTSTLPVDSMPLTETINKWGTTTTVATTQTPSPLGTSLTFTITVSPTSTVVPSGTVTLQDGTNTLATLSLNPQGSATFTTSELSVGTHAITAQFLGDATNDVSTSAPLSQVIQKIDTSTTLTSSLNPANGGATIHLTATTTAASTNAIAGPLTGTVTFTDGSTTLGAASVAANGTATLDVSTLVVGPHTIVATFSGNSGYATSASPALTQVVQLATTNVQVSSSVSPSYGGNEVVFSAVVSGNGGVPTGTVTFLDGGTQIGQGSLNATGQVSIKTSSLTPGTHTITASYGGDAEDSTSTSLPLTQVVQQASTAISLISSNNPAIAGTIITFGATVSSNGSIPSGQLQLMEGSNVLATANISPGGSAQFTLNTLSIGTHTLVAYFAGSTLNAAASSAFLNQVINAGTTATALTSSANPSVVNSSVTFTASVTGQGNQPTGTVTFSDGASVLGTGTLNAQGVAIFSTSSLALGVHNITANYAGDSTHSASAPAAISQSVQQSTTTSLSSNVNPSLVGNAIVLTATVKGGSNQSVSGNVSFYDAGTLLGTTPVNSGVAALNVSSLTAGSHLILAQYAGDQGSQPSQSATLSQVVNTAGTTVTLASNTNPAVAGNAIVFTASVVSTGEAPNGPVTFLDGSTTLGTANVSNGTASLSISTLSAGQHAITARYGGSAGTQTSSSAVLLQVVQQPTSVALVSNGNPILTAQSVTFSATIAGSNPTGSVTFMDGSVSFGQAVVNGGTATITVPSLSSGSHAITASYSGDNFNLASTSKPLVETVNMRPSTTSMTASSQTYTGGDELTLVGVVHVDGPVVPTGTVTFTANGLTLGTANVTSSGAATLIFSPQASSYDIVASYSGDAVYSPSTAGAYSIKQGTGVGFHLTVDPTSSTMASGDHITLNIAMNSNGSFSDTVSLACLNLPTYATCTFSPTQVKLGGNGSVTAQVVVDTGLPLGSGPRANVQSGDSREAAFAFPAAILLGLLTLFGKRRRGLGIVLAILFMAAASIGITGCGSSFTQNKTAPGTYNIRVLATGSSTGVTESANVALTVQ